jgi:cyanate permease
VVTALWIIYGAAIALRMAVFTQTAISWQEGVLWFALASLLSIFAYLKESFTRKNNDNAIRGLREQLIRLQAFGEGTASAMAVH